MKRNENICDSILILDPKQAEQLSKQCTFSSAKKITSKWSLEWLVQGGIVKRPRAYTSTTDCIIQNRILAHYMGGQSAVNSFQMAFHRITELVSAQVLKFRLAPRFFL